MARLALGILVSLFLVSASARADPAVPAGAMVDLNVASQNDLVALPGIGPAKAQAIVSWRQKNGRFRRVEDLVKVKGFGRKTLLKLRPYLLVTSVEKLPAPS
jgi:competence protein ComEA